jgi:hypothetical protein
MEVAMRKKIFLMILVGLTLLSIPKRVLAQDSDKVVILSPRVGSVIDAAERERYELFQGIKGFDRAVFLQTPEKTHYAKIMSIGADGARRDTTVQYSEDVLKVLAERIEHFEDLKEKRYHMGDQPTKIELAESTMIRTGETVARDLQAQQDTVTTARLQKIILKDGSEMIGAVTSRDSGLIRFKTLSNVSMTIPNTQVREIETLSGEVVGGEYRRADPNQTRLLFAPNARSLKAGQGYFSAYEIFFPFLAVGVTDFATVSGGMTLFPGASNQLFYLAPKVRAIHVKEFDLAGGVLYLNATSGSSEGVGILYGVGTYGTANDALTVGLGWGFAQGKVKDKPILLLGGEVRVSNSVKLITENWIPPSSDVSLISFGVRFFGDNLAADLGFIYPAGSEISGFPFLPWLGFAYNFGGKQ